MTEASKTVADDPFEDETPEPVKATTAATKTAAPAKAPVKRRGRPAGSTKAEPKTPKVKQHPELPASYPSASGEYMTNVSRPWGPVVVAVIPRGWHGAAPLTLPIKDLPELLESLQKALDEHEGQV